MTPEAHETVQISVVTVGVVCVASILMFAAYSCDTAKNGELARGGLLLP